MSYEETQLWEELSKRRQKSERHQTVADSKSQASPQRGGTQMKGYSSGRPLVGSASMAPRKEKSSKQHLHIDEGGGYRAASLCIRC
jgi:hypothetical protein